MNIFVSQEYSLQSAEYHRLLVAIAKLSGLFSEGTIPYINYRVAENVFCRSFRAENLSRSDTAFDAKLGSLGIGLKTFVCPGAYSTEKVAEFNDLSSQLRKLEGKELAIALAEARNQRIRLACDLYGVDQSVYHIVARRDKELLLFETDYDTINLERLRLEAEQSKSLVFSDGNHQYRFNYSKSTLYRRFDIPEDPFRIPVEILDDPYSLLSYLEEWQRSYRERGHVAGRDYVVLPLYSTRKGASYGEVPEKSGLNQWNAGGRARDYGEVYIPVPSEVHKHCVGFFPQRDVSFTIRTPRGESFSAKLCQENSKALMTNPNNALSDWLLRGLCRLLKGELLTRERLDLLGFDSVLITKEAEGRYLIDVRSSGAYEDFINQFSTQ